MPVLFIVGIAPVQGRVGMAEWEVYTPGGHLISDTDVQDPEQVPCLRTDAQSDAGQTEILVPRLKRWRYYADHIVGESEAGRFVFTESTRKLTWPNSESGFATALEDLGPPLGPWMEPADGWREAWFPYMVWRPCRDRLANTAYPSEAECRDASDPKWMTLYRLTTWGRMCRQWKAAGVSMKSEAAFLESFCDELLAGNR